MNRRLTRLLCIVLMLAMAIPGFALAEGESKEVVTLQWYGSGNRQQTFDGFYNNFFEKELGIRIEFVFDSPEKTQAMMASGDLPDIGGYLDADTKTLLPAIAGNLLVDLDPHLAQMPDVAIHEKVLKYARAVYCGDKGLFGIPMGIGTVEPTNQFPVDPSHNAINLRWDVYDAIGAPEVKSMDDLVDVLKQMVEYMPTLPDGTKTYGAGLAVGWGEGALFPVPTMTGLITQGIFESLQGLNEYDIKADTLTPILDENSHFLDSVSFYFKLNQAGLLDPDSIYQYYQASQAKMDLGQYMMCGWAQWPDGYNNSHNFINPPSAYLPLNEPWITLQLNSATGYGAAPISISANTKELDACVKFVNFLFNADANLTLYNGPQGLLWDAVDGKLVSTDAYQEVRKNGSYLLETGEDIATYIMGFGLSDLATHPAYNEPMKQWRWAENIAASTQGNVMLDKWAAKYGHDLPIQAFQADDRLALRPSAVVFVASPDEDMIMIKNAVEDLVRTELWKMIFAKDQAEFDSLYQNMVTNAKGLGYDTLTEWGAQAFRAAQEVDKQYQD